MSHVREVPRKGGRVYEVRRKDAGLYRQRAFAQKREANRFALRVENARLRNGNRRLDWSRPMNVGSLRRYYLLPAAAQAGLPPPAVPRLRHTFASLALAAGFQPVVVSRWTGHAPVTTTDTLYPTDYAAELERFESFVKPA